MPKPLFQVGDYVYKVEGTSELFLRPYDAARGYFKKYKASKTVMVKRAATRDIRPNDKSSKTTVCGIPVCVLLFVQTHTAELHPDNSISINTY